MYERKLLHGTFRSRIRNEGAALIPFDLWCRYLEKLSEKTASKLQRELDREQQHPQETEPEPQEQELAKDPPAAIDLPSGIEFTVAEPITDRKSVFIGRACRITHHEQVPQALAYLMADKRIARSAFAFHTL